MSCKNTHTMSVVSTVVVIFVLGSAISMQIERKKRQEEFEEKLKSAIKIGNKRRFINKFIDEIPELSYYEAVQLKKKLAKIYLEWNDE